MNSKKSLLIILMILILLIVGALIWRNYESSNSIYGFGKLPGKNLFVGDSKPTSGLTGGNAEKLNNDIYVEILAQTGYQYQVNKDPQIWANNMKALYAKYGVTEADITAYAKMLEGNATKAQEVSSKYMKRLIELQTTGK